LAVESSIDLSKTNLPDSFQKMGLKEERLANYTVLIYMIGSDFETRKYTASNDIQEMVNAKPDSSINIVLQTGGGIQGNASEIDFSSVQRHQIVNGTLQNLMDLGHKNMAESATLSDFINWGVSKFPANKYAIIFWDHGSGIHGFGKDVNFINDALSPSELFNGFYRSLNKTGVNFELIGFDACLMSSLEVASKLNYFSNYMVASEEIEPEWGWNYTDIIKNLVTDPNQSGYTLGKTIIDSYDNSSKYLSESEKYGTHHEITLSLLNMTNIPQLENYVNNLSKSIKTNIQDLNSSISLSKSIDQTERYGQSALGRSTGLIDLYDFTVSLEERYPDLKPTINLVQNSINSTVLYSTNGEARPNAKGISVYMPLYRSEYDDKVATELLDVDWLILLSTQRSMIESDTVSPIIKSGREGNTIKGSVYGSDVANIFSEIIMKSSNGTNLIYRQQTDNSFIDDKGHFNYNESEILSLCNETECIPTSMNIESSRDKKFVFIPIKLELPNGNINNNLSLVYEDKKDGNFTFLGVTPETNPEETIPKGKTGLAKNDKIFLEASPAKAMFAEVSNMNSTKFREISEFMTAGPLLVNAPEKILPQYRNISSPYYISFTICDYSDNCDKSRWYHISHKDNSTLIPAKNDQFGFVVASTNKSSLPHTDITNYTYVNPTFGFEVDYPSDWKIKIQNMTDFSDYDLSPDPFIIQFIPSEYTEVYETKYSPSLTISGTDWPFKETTRSLFDYINTTNSYNFTNLQTEEKLISGNPSFTYIFEYLSPAELYLEIADEKRKQLTTSILVNGTMYNLSFESYASQFDEYQPIIEKIVNSFREYSVQNQTNSKNVENKRLLGSSIMANNSVDRQQNSYNERSTDKENITENLYWSKYIDPNYGYIIDYPSNVGIGKPLPMDEYDSSLTGNLFFLDNASKELKDGGFLIIDAFSIYEKPKLKKYFNIGLFDKMPDNLDIDFIVTSENEKLGIYEMMPSFNLLKNNSLKINNNDAHIVEFDYYNSIARDEVYEVWAYITDGSHLAILQLNSGSQNYEQYYPLFQRMLNSFQFDKK
jgi:hypothetical protein